MQKRLRLRFPGPLAGTFLVLGLQAVLAPSRPVSRPAWWEVRLTVVVKGEYALRGGREPISGEFACRARWEGKLEPDGDDFLLVHFQTEILEWSLREKAGPRDRPSVLETPDGPRPFLHLNYVLKEGQEVVLDFELDGIPVPRHASALKVPLELASSSGPGAGMPHRSYNDFVQRGSNRVVVAAADFERRSRERAFSWKWRRERKLAECSGEILFVQGHTAEAVVGLVAH